jgi:hypothetical protein
MAKAKLQPTTNPFLILLLIPVAYVRYTEMRAIEQGERKVAMPKRNKPAYSPNIFLNLQKLIDF